MLALFAVLVLAPLLYVPGFCISVAILGRAQPPDALERHFERVLAGALLNGWLALFLAELGVFSAALHLVLVLLLCVLCVGVARRRGLPVRTMVAPAKYAARVDARLDAALFAAVGLVFALLVARPFEVVLGARDAGVYAATGFAIARTGGIVQHDALLQQIAADEQAGDPALSTAARQAETNLLGTQDKERYLATRLRFAGFLINNGELGEGRVVPQFFHLYPTWIALLASLIGLRGGLLATSMFGLLGVWSVGMLGRRLAGRWVGVLGMLFLVLNGAQVWFSRYSTSEACAQFLSFAALYFFAVMQSERVSATESMRPQWAGLLAGIAAGQLALARIDFFPIVFPFLIYLAYMALTKRWTQPVQTMALGIGLVLAHWLIHIITISRAYVIDTLFARLQDQSAIIATLTLPLLNPTLREIFYGTSRSVLKQPWRLPAEIILLLALLAAFVLLRRDGRPQRWFERQVRRWQRWLVGFGALAVLLLGVYGYLVRPQILDAQVLAALPGCFAAPASPACLRAQGYVGAPIAPPQHPNFAAYALMTLPKSLRPVLLPAAVGSVQTASAADMRELPAAGGVLAQQVAGADMLVLGKDARNLAYLVRDAEGRPGWVLTPTLQLSSAVSERLPVIAPTSLQRVVYPRSETSFSFGNPGEAQKIGIAQANLVRVGWYLSPLGMLLALAGAALWWWRGMNRASWVFLVASLASTFFFVRLSYGTTDLTYIYILRRYIPLAYPALSLCAAYALVALAGRMRPAAGDPQQVAPRPAAPGSRLWRVAAAALLALAQIAFFVVTNRQLYQHVEYAGALDQLAAIAGEFKPGDVVLFRGEGRDTPDLVATPLKYAFGLDTFAIRSTDPGPYAAQLAEYVRRWQAQGRQVFLVLGANGSVALPGLQPVRVGSATLRLPEFQQLREQKPSVPLEFAFDFATYRLEPAGGAPAGTTVAVGDFTAQLRGFYHPEAIGGATVAWTNGDAVLRLPWPRAGRQLAVTLDLAAGATRPAALGPARACVSFQPAADFAVPGAPFQNEQCFEPGAEMRSYTYSVDITNIAAPPTGTFLLRIAGPTWVPAQADPAQHDQRTLGVQFGGAQQP